VVLLVLCCGCKKTTAFTGRHDVRRERTVV
jgi:hypothetical protein